MVNISRMARAAGIGSAVGAAIGGIKEANDKDGDVLGGIVGGAIPFFFNILRIFAPVISLD